MVAHVRRCGFLSHKGGIGVGGSRRRMGGTNYCICPVCKRKFPHIRGKPCIKRKCPYCNVPLVGAW